MGGGDPAASCSKASKQANLVEGKFCFISDAGNWWGGWWISVQRPTPPTPCNKQGVRVFIDKVCVCGGVTCRNSIVISNSHLQLFISGITSIILVILGTVNVQFQGAGVPISLQSILIIMEAQVLGTVWSSCS